MPIPTAYTFTRYLAAKKTVDDRALNRQVWDTLKQSLPAGPLRVLEIGAGIGTMVERALSWDLLRQASYTALDAEPSNITEARRRLPQWARDEGFRVEEKGMISLRRDTQAVSLTLEAIDLFDFITREQGHHTWDLLIAHAFIDLVDIPTTLPALLSLLPPGGLFYFSLVFDGATILQPDIEPAFDARIEQLYHQTMDKRIIQGRPSGDSQSGRHLFDHLRAAGVELLAAGGSDWVVFAGPHGYEADEAYFLHFIIQTVQSALTEHAGLDAARFADWIAQRHAQIDRGELIYIAHQLDFVGRRGT